jgi:hypothetical protein
LLGWLNNKKKGWVRNVTNMGEERNAYNVSGKTYRKNKIKYKRIRQTHLVYLLFIVDLVTCFDPAGSSSGLYVNQVMLKTAYIFESPLMFVWYFNIGIFRD